MSIQIVVVGNAFDGMKAYGPFFAPEDATDFGDTCGADDWLVVDLAAPYRQALVDLPGAEGDVAVGLWAGDLADLSTPFGIPEVLMTLWPDGQVEAAVRLREEHSWGPPTILEQKETR